MLTIKQYNDLSPARKAYIEKQAKKKGLSIEDYLIKNNQKNTPEIKSVSYEHNGETIHVFDPEKFGNVDPMTDFKPDAGISFKKLNKTSYKMNLMHFGTEIIQSSLKKIPHRNGEFTCTIPFNGKEYCATFKLNDRHRAKIADAFRKGCMGVTLKFGFSGKVQTAHEWIRLLKITDVIPSDEVYGVGGNFAIAFPMQGINATFYDVAKAWMSPLAAKAHYA